MEGEACGWAGRRERLGPRSPNSCGRSCSSARLANLVLYCANFSSVRETVRTTMKGTLVHRGTRGKAHQDSYPYFMFIIMQGHAGITSISRVEHALKWAGGAIPACDQSHTLYAWARSLVRQVTNSISSRTG